MVLFEKIEIFDSPEKGRGIRATDHINIGEEIFSEKPIAYTLTNSKYRGTRCDFCFVEAEKLSRCSQCMFVSYCGKKCQTSDWPIHKHECKCLMKVAPKQPPDICRIASHLLFKCYLGKDEEACSLHKEIQNLASNQDCVPNSRKEAFFTFSAVLYEYLQECTFNIESADVFGILCRISCNSFTITNSELNSLGTGVYKTASFLNHSCDPNCFALFDGPNIAIRSIKDIAPGDELVLSYVNLLAPSDIRKSELKEGYMFVCKCNVCSGKLLTDFIMNSIKCDDFPCSCSLSLLHLTDSCVNKSCSCEKQCTISNDLHRIATSCVDDLNAIYNEVKVVPTQVQQNVLQKAITQAEKVLNPIHISLLRCYEVAMDGCLEREQWRKALEYSKKLEQCYNLYLSTYHPSIGLHYFKQGKLETFLNKLKDGLNSLEKAQKVLRVTHGRKHELVLLLENTLAQLSEEIIEQQRMETLEQIHKDEE